MTQRTPSWRPAREECGGNGIGLSRSALGCRGHNRAGVGAPVDRWFSYVNWSARVAFFSPSISLLDTELVNRTFFFASIFGIHKKKRRPKFPFNGLWNSQKPPKHTVLLQFELVWRAFWRASCRNRQRKPRIWGRQIRSRAAGPAGGLPEDLKKQLICPYNRAMDADPVIGPNITKGWYLPI